MLQHKRRMFLVAGAAFAVLILGTASPAGAYDGNRDQNGFRDQRGYHHYGYRHHHRGYWNEQNGVRLWINI